MFDDDASDIILGGDDNDIIYGYGGSDRLSGDAGDDLIIAGAGSDIVSGGAGSDALHGGMQAEFTGTFVSPDIDDNDVFGEAVRLSGKYAIISAGNGDNSGVNDTGTVHVYDVETRNFLYN